MSDAIRARLEWQGGEAFAVSTRGHGMTVDGGAGGGATPMEHLAVAIAGCMGIDVVHILGKMRQPPEELSVEAEAIRAESEPRRFTRVRLAFLIVGEVRAASVDRALELSRDKYCSAWATIRPDVELELDYEISPPPPA